MTYGLVLVVDGFHLGIPALQLVDELLALSDASLFQLSHLLLQLGAQFTCLSARSVNRLVAGGRRRPVDSTTSSSSSSSRTGRRLSH